MRITRYPHITEVQFFGCVAAFVDSFTGELNAATAALRRLEDQSKGSAFAYEMKLDQHRYGALIVLDRWSTFVNAFGPHLQLSRRPAILTDAASRIQSTEKLLHTANQVIDAADRYAREVVEVCSFAWQSAGATFSEERSETEQTATLGPMLPEDYTSARRIFLEDLAAR